MACSECQDSDCEGLNRLRHFADWDDLSSHLSEEIIVEFVNQLAAVRQSQRDMGKRYRLKQQHLARVAKRLLDPDELEEIQRQIEESV